MKITLTLVFFTLIFVGCEAPYIFNRVINQKNGDKMLYGGVDRTAFEKEPFSTWFFQEYDSYQTNPELIKKFKAKIKRYRIEVFMGTWCDDSKREYPRLLKILDEAKFPEARLVTYAVNENKKSFYGEEVMKDIQFVPTIIFYKGGEEVARIVESPVSDSLEEDIWRIIQGDPLPPNYSEN